MAPDLDFSHERGPIRHLLNYREMSQEPMQVGSDPLLDDLTEPQREAATHVDGPLLVLAGAGSGKTRVITRRIAHLVLRVGIPPWNVLAITFTNKAAGEMRERVAKLVSERQARAITVCTFHSLCARLIRQYAHKLELPPGYSIYDTADQSRAVKNALEALEINTGNFPPAKVLSTISSAKNELIDPDAYAASAHDFYSKTVAKIYRKYQEVLAQNKALDFDDLLVQTANLIRNHPDVLAELRERYQYLLIDEYQDTNHSQFIIANALGAQHRNICATGDPDQSIYGWRGANIRNILEFETHYPDAKVVRLEQNYRSTKNILAVADALIRNNKHRKHKSLWTENEAGDPVRVVTVYDERKEAQWVVEQFQDWHDNKKVPWGGMAVFYRINSLSRVIEDALRTAGIPYQIARGTAFYERKEIKDAVAYLRVIVNPFDEVNLTRIINTPARGISEATVEALRAAAVAQNKPLFEVLRSVASLTAVNARAVAAVLRFAKMVEEWRKALGIFENNNARSPIFDLNAPDTPTSADDLHSIENQKSKIENPSTLRSFVERVLVDSGLHEHYRTDKTDPEGERLANLGELVSSAQQFEDDLEASLDGRPTTLHEKVTAYLEQISLVSDVDTVNPDQGAVTLMTLHAAKGLEFPVVAMLGVEDGLLPHSRAQTNPHEMEEERRLCFVGFTRAQRMLMVSHARYRTIFGQTTPTIPSRFLNELPSNHLQVEDISNEESWTAGEDRFSGINAQREAAREAAAQYRPGELVRHPQFGLGRVLTINPMGAQTRAQIAFNTAGVKTLILQYARLEKI